MSDDLQVNISTDKAVANLNNLDQKLVTTAGHTDALISKLDSLKDSSGSINIDVFATLKTSKEDLAKQISALTTEAKSVAAKNPILFDIGINKSSISKMKTDIHNAFNNFSVDVKINIDKSSLQSAVSAQPQKKVMQKQLLGLDDVEVEAGKVAKKIQSKGDNTIKFKADIDTSAISSAISAFNGSVINALIDADIDSRKISEKLESQKHIINIKPIVDVALIQKQLDMTAFHIKTNAKVSGSGATDSYVQGGTSPYQDGKQKEYQNKISADTQAFYESQRKAVVGSKQQEEVRHNISTDTKVSYADKELLMSILDRKMSNGFLEKRGFGSPGDVEKLRMTMPSDYLKSQVEALADASGKIASAFNVAKKDIIMAGSDLVKSPSGIASIDNTTNVIDTERFRSSLNMNSGKNAAEFMMSQYMDDIRKSISTFSGHDSDKKLFSMFYDEKGPSHKKEDYAPFANEQLTKIFTSGTGGNQILEDISRKYIIPHLEKAGYSSEVLSKRLEAGAGLFDFKKSGFAYEENKKVSDKEYEKKNTSYLDNINAQKEYREQMRKESEERKAQWALEKAENKAYREQIRSEIEARNIMLNQRWNDSRAEAALNNQYRRKRDAEADARRKKTEDNFILGNDIESIIGTEERSRGQNLSANKIGIDVNKFSHGLENIVFKLDKDYSERLEFAAEHTRQGIPNVGNLSSVGLSDLRRQLMPDFMKNQFGSSVFSTNELLSSFGLKDLGKVNVLPQSEMGNRQVGIKKGSGEFAFSQEMIRDSLAHDGGKSLSKQLSTIVSKEMIASIKTSGSTDMMDAIRKEFNDSGASSVYGKNINKYLSDNIIKALSTGGDIPTEIKNAISNHFVRNVSDLDVRKTLEDKLAAGAGLIGMDGTKHGTDQNRKLSEYQKNVQNSLKQSQIQKENREWLDVRDFERKTSHVVEGLKKQGNAFEFFMDNARQGFIEWGLSMSGIAASIFVFQQVSAIVMELAKNFDEAVMGSARLSQSVNLNAKDYVASKTFIGETRKETGLKTDAITGAMSSAMRQGLSYESAIQVAPEIAKITEAGLTKDSDQAAQVIIKNSMGIKDAYIEFLSITDNTYTDKFEKLGGALDNLKGSFEGAFGDDIKSYLENITEWVNNNNKTIVGFVGVLAEAIKLVGVLGVGYAAYKGVSSLNRTGHIQQETMRIFNASAAQGVGVSKFDAHSQAIAEQQGKPSPAIGIGNIGSGLKQVASSFGIGAGVVVASLAAEKLVGVMYDVYKLSDNIEKSQKKFAENLGMSAEQYKKMSVSQTELNNGTVSFNKRFDEMNFSQKKQMFDNIPKRKTELKEQLETIAWKQSIDTSNVGGYNDEENKNYKGELLSKMNFFKRMSQASTTGIDGDKVIAIKEEFEKLKTMQEKYKKWFDDNGIDVGPNSARTYEDLVATHKAMYDKLGVASKLYDDNLKSETEKNYNTIIELAKKHGDKMQYLLSDQAKKRLGLEKKNAEETTTFFANEMKKREDLARVAARESLLFETIGANKEEKVKADADVSVTSMNAVLTSLDFSKEDIGKMQDSMISMFTDSGNKKLGEAALSKIEEMMKNMGSVTADSMKKNKHLFVEAFKRAYEADNGKSEYTESIVASIVDGIVPTNKNKQLEEGIKRATDGLKAGIPNKNIGGMEFEKILLSKRAFDKKLEQDALIPVNVMDEKITGKLSSKEQDSFVEYAKIIDKISGKSNEKETKQLLQSSSERNISADEMKKNAEVLITAGKTQGNLAYLKDGMFGVNLSKILSGELKDIKAARLKTESDYASFIESKIAEEESVITNVNKLTGKYKDEVSAIKVRNKIQDLNTVGFDDKTKKELSGIISENQKGIEEKEAKYAEINLYEEKGKLGDEDAAIKAMVEKYKISLSEDSFSEKFIDQLSDAMKDIYEVNKNDKKIKELSDVMQERFQKTGKGLSEAVKAIATQEANNYSKVIDLDSNKKIIDKTSMSIASRNILKDIKDSKVKAFMDMLSTKTGINDIIVFSESQKEELKKALSMSDKQLSTIEKQIKTIAVDDKIKEIEESISKNSDVSSASKSKIELLKKLYADQLTNAVSKSILSEEESGKIKEILNIDKFSGSNAIGNEERFSYIEKLVIPAREYYNAVGAMSKELYDQEMDFIDKRAAKYKAIGADLPRIEKNSAAEKRQAFLSLAMVKDKPMYDGIGSETLQNAGFGTANISAMSKGFTSFSDESIDQMKRWSSFGKSVAADFEDSMVGAFKGSADGFDDFAKRVVDSFSEMIIKMQLNSFMTSTVNPLISSGVSALTNLLPGAPSAVQAPSYLTNTQFPSLIHPAISPTAKGAAFVDGAKFFADGGVFTNKVYSNPTQFKFASGSGFNLGVMGEAGPEAIMPLARDSSGSLGVKTLGNSENNSEMNIEINITNEGNEKLQASKAEASFDETGKMVLNIVMQGIQNNQGGIRKLIQTVSKQ